MATKVKWYGRRYTNRLYNYADGKMKAGSNRMAQQAKNNAPVRSGALMESIGFKKVKRMEYKVGSDKPYAAYVEYGTSKMPAKPYLRPAMNQSRGTF